MNLPFWYDDDEAKSANVAARIDGLRYLDTNIEVLSDEGLRELYVTFEAHIKTLTDFIQGGYTDEVTKTLATAIDLIQKHYIVPLEAEMARRWRMQHAE